jgi:hypothetical protein
MNRIRMLLRRNILCRIFGHVITDVRLLRGTAICGRCGYMLDVRYDLAYGEMVVIGVRYKTNKVAQVYEIKTKEGGEIK